ncbi:hypothetical protein BY996DRAFT_6418565, partial [Phakopsora pachyrhizi]
EATGQAAIPAGRVMGGGVRGRPAISSKAGASDVARVGLDGSWCGRRAPAIVEKEGDGEVGGRMGGAAAGGELGGLLGNRFGWRDGPGVGCRGERNGEGGRSGIGFADATTLGAVTTTTELVWDGTKGGEE